MIALIMQHFILNIVVLQYFFDYLFGDLTTYYQVYQRKFLKINGQYDKISVDCHKFPWNKRFVNMWNLLKLVVDFQFFFFTPVTSIKGYILLSIKDRFCQKFYFTPSSRLTTKSQRYESLAMFNTDDS